MTKPKFKTESDMCQSFLKLVPAEYQAYNETGGFDILLVRKSDGFQIGIEAKLTLNAKVVCQAAEDMDIWSVVSEGPDCRAILVPDSSGSDLSSICKRFGLEVIRLRHPDDMDQWMLDRTDPESRKGSFKPDLPVLGRYYDYTNAFGQTWPEHCPHHRITLPDYIPDNEAGTSSPIRLTDWKVRAIKLAITLEKVGYLTRTDFKHHQVSMSRWTQGGMVSWLKNSEHGKWVKGNRFPNFKIQHPVNYEEIAEKYDAWKTPFENKLL